MNENISDFGLLMAIICVVALVTVTLDLTVWRKEAPASVTNCVKPEPRTAKAIAIYNSGCTK